MNRCNGSLGNKPKSHWYLSIYVRPHSTLPSSNDDDMLGTFYLLLAVVLPDLYLTQLEHD